MAITKTEILTLLDTHVTKVKGELDTVMASGDLDERMDELEMMRCVAALQRCENAKTWVENNL